MENGEVDDDGGVVMKKRTGARCSISGIWKAEGHLPVPPCFGDVTGVHPHPRLFQMLKSRPCLPSSGLLQYPAPMPSYLEELAKAKEYSAELPIRELHVKSIQS